MSWEWIIALGFVSVCVWQYISKTREEHQRNRWIRTHVGPGLGLDPEQTEELIERYDKAETARTNFRAGQWEA